MHGSNPDDYIVVRHNSIKFTFLLPRNTKKKYFPAIRRMLKKFLANGSIRGKGKKPDYHGYLFDVIIGDRPILREIMRSLKKKVLRANFNRLRVKYQK
jgi:hypothetical protein